MFRSCLIPGQSYARLTPFGGEPPENNIAKAQKLSLATAAGLWRLAEEALAQLLVLQDGGLAHGDTELHNIIVCPAPLEPILVDFEAAVRRDAIEPAAWDARCSTDLEPLLREAVYLQCALGRQPSQLGELSWSRLARAVSLSRSISSAPSSGRPRSESPTLRHFAKGLPETRCDTCRDRRTLRASWRTRR